MAETGRLPVPRAEQWDWQLEAACRDYDNAVFFHPEHERGEPRHRREAAAKAICARCPVQPACLRHAVQAREPYGIWGGLSEHERRLVTQRST